MKTSIYSIIIWAISIVLLSACGPAATISPVATNTPLPTATEVAAPTEAPTAVPAVELTAMPSVPFPATWTVSETNSADGRTIYVVDDPGGTRAAREGYERLRDYYTFPNGLPSSEQLEKDAAEFTVDPDRARGMIETIEQWRSEGGYWVFLSASAWTWEGAPEFTADGSQVTMVMTVPDHNVDWVSLESGEIRYAQRLTGVRATVTMIYDEQTGSWRVLAEDVEEKTISPVASVTPRP